MDKPKSTTCFCTKPWNCGYNRDGWCDFHNESCREICIAYGGGAPMTNRDASAALSCALQWNGSGQYDHDTAKEAVRVAQSALEKIPKMEDQIRELTKINRHLQNELDAAIRCIPRACAYCKHAIDYGPSNAPGCKNPECFNISGINTGFEWRGAPEVKG